jgi:hypothetical protein
VTEAEWNDALAYELTQPIAELKRNQRRARFIFTGLAVLAALMYIASWLDAASRLWAVRQSGDWSGFWDAYKSHVSIALFLGSIYSVSAVLTGGFNQVLAVRRTVEVSNTTIAPVAPDQPLPLSPDEMPKGSVRFVSLVRSERAAARRLQIKPGILFFVMGAGCAGLAVLFLALASELALGPWLTVIVLILFAMTLGSVATGVLMLLRARRSYSPLQLAADEWGLTWDSARVRRYRIQIAWHEAQAFFRATLGPSAGATARAIYVLDVGDAVLAWALPPSATPEEREASERLSRLIVTRTRLPLRSVALDLLLPVPTSDELAAERKPPDPSCLGVLAVLALSGSLGALGWILERLHA